MTKQKVLFVEDDHSNLIAFEAIVDICDISIELLIAFDGQEAIKIAKENLETKLILMDIMLPKLNGLEAIKSLRKIPSFSETPIIAITALAMEKDKALCLAAGATDYISKPYQTDAIMNLFEKYLS